MKPIFLFMIITILAIPIVAEAQDFSITIDTEKDAFYKGLTGPSDGLIFMPSKCFLRDIGDGTGPDDDFDLSAIVWFSYDSLYIYCYAEVTDDAVRVVHTSRYLNDNIEFKFDPEPDAGATGGTSHLRLTALGESFAETLSGVDNLNGSGGLMDLSGQPYQSTEDDYARRETDLGYILEFRVRRDCINTPDGRSLEYNTTGVFGMAINVADNDEGERDNMLQWSAGHTDLAWNTPIHHGSVTFMENHILKFEAKSPMDPSVVNENADDWYSNPYPAGVSDAAAEVVSYKLLTNYPNPFNPVTKIQYHINVAETVTLAIYNITGELISDLIVDQYHKPGVHEITWNGRNELGATVSSGIYIYRLVTASKIVSNKMMLLK
jgi:hypothetical protein